jgi:inhibitor of cysteine peptidase
MKKLFAFLFLLLCACRQDYVYLSEQDSGRDITLNVGQSAIITLAENPTTGYAWIFEIEPKEQNVITNIREKYVHQKTNLIGSGGIKEYSFKAENSGRVDIYGYYVRSWEEWDKNKVQSVRYSIIAK